MEINQKYLLNMLFCDLFKNSDNFIILVTLKCFRFYLFHSNIKKNYGKMAQTND